MSLKLYRWNNYVVPGAYPGRLQYIDPDEWTPYLDRHLTEVDEGTVPEKQLLRLWAEAGQTPESFDSRHGSPEWPWGVDPADEAALADAFAEIPEENRTPWNDDPGFMGGFGNQGE